MSIQQMAQDTLKRTGDTLGNSAFMCDECDATVMARQVIDSPNIEPWETTDTESSKQKKGKTGGRVRKRKKNKKKWW